MFCLPANVRLIIADFETGSTLEVSDFLKAAKKEAGECRLCIVVILFSPFLEQTRKNCSTTSSQKDNIMKRMQSFQVKVIGFIKCKQSYLYNSIPVDSCNDDI